MPLYNGTGALRVQESSMDGRSGLYAGDGAYRVVLTNAEFLVEAVLQYLADNGLSAEDVNYTPSGTIAASTVAGAISELDSEKLGKAGDTGVGVYTILGTSFTPQTPPSGTLLLLGQQGTSTRFTFDNYVDSAAGNNIASRKARGTAAAPTALQAGDQILNLALFGYGATGYNPTTRGGIIATASENWTDTEQGVSIDFACSPAGMAGAWPHLALYNKHVGIGVGVNDVDLQMGTTTVIDTDRLFRKRAYTVATLPTPGIPGRQAYCSNARVMTAAFGWEGAGAGTGGNVSDNGTNWVIAGTNNPAVA